MNTTNDLLRRVLPVLLLVSLGSCAAVQKLWNSEYLEYPDSGVENLERLHTPSGKHHYTVRFTGDVEHALGHNASISGMRFGAPSTSRSGKPKQLKNPSATCLDLLDTLFDIESSGNPRLEAVQVAWCAKIIEQDPSVLSRERAVRALADIGKRRGAREPYLLRIDAPRANAEETAGLVANMLSAWRRLRDEVGTEAEWKDSLLAIEQTSFDLGGYRRILPVVAGLFDGIKPDDPQFEALVEFTQELEVSTICFAFGEALTQKTFGGSVVRAAAVRALGVAGGSVSIARLMPYLRAEHESGQDRDPFLVSEILANVAHFGFPETIPNLEQSEYVVIRENWYSLIVSIAVADPESQLRVKACQALSKVTGKAANLREEEWEDWLYSRANARQAQEAAGAPAATADNPDSAGAGDGGS